MKRKVIGLIVGSVIFSIFFLVGCTKENEEYKKFITDRVHIYNHIEKEEIVEDTSNTNLKKVHKNKTDFFEIEGVEVVEDTDFDSFLPSYNLFVTKALVEKDTEVDYYYTWFNIKDDRKVDFDSSCLFLNYCGYNSEILNSIIPSVYNPLPDHPYWFPCRGMASRDRSVSSLPPPCRTTHGVYRR